MYVTGNYAVVTKKEVWVEVFLWSFRLMWVKVEASTLHKLLTILNSIKRKCHDPSTLLNSVFW